MSERIPTREEAEVLAFCVFGADTNDAGPQMAVEDCDANGWLRWYRTDPDSYGDTVGRVSLTTAGRAALARAKEAGIVG